MLDHDFEPREIRSFDIEADLAPEIDERVTRYRRPGGPPDDFVTEYGSGPWEVAQIFPISSRPGWVRVYVILVERTSAIWEDEELSFG
jgi:hypothetical protein